MRHTPNQSLAGPGPFYMLGRDRSSYKNSSETETMSVRKPPERAGEDEC